MTEGMPVIRALSNMFDRWFPKPPDRKQIEPKLADFYGKNRAYHEMTGSEDKLKDSQVRLLSCLIEKGKKYAEIGCGSGVVCRMVGEMAFVYGIDVSPIAISRGKAAVLQYLSAD